MSGQRSDWRERLHANPSRMEQELAIKLQDDGITYLNWAIVRRLLLCPVPCSREAWGPFCQLGLCDTRFGPCCVWAQLLRSFNARCHWFWLDPRYVPADCQGWKSGSRVVDSFIGEVVGLLGSCSLSFSHFGPISPDEDLACCSIFFGSSTLTPLLEPVASQALPRRSNDQR